MAKAAAAPKADDLFLDEAKIEFGPCVTNPEKILCVGLNYTKHAKETNNPIPKMPILFNKFNNALNAHNGTVRVSAERFDDSGLIGPYIVTADQVDPNNLKIEGTVNGEVRQSSNTSERDIGLSERQAGVAQAGRQIYHHD